MRNYKDDKKNAYFQYKIVSKYRFQMKMEYNSNSSQILNTLASTIDQTRITFSNTKRLLNICTNFSGLEMTLCTD